MYTQNDRVWDLFVTAVNAAGGSGAMVRERRLGWLPDLLESAYTLLLQEEDHRGPEEIADLLGTTRDAVESMLTGPADIAQDRIIAPPPSDETEREHIAGGLVRLAYVQAEHRH